MKITKRIALFLSIVMLMSLVIACTPQTETKDPAASTQETQQDSSGENETTTPAKADDPIRVALVVNQKFGDLGPCDQMLAGLEKARDDFGVEIKALESDGVAAHEDDVRAMAREGYDLIITTFPNMTQATVTVADEYPDTSFGCIYQFVNNAETSVANIYDAQFEGQDAMYILGAMAATLTRTNKVGFIAGAEEPSPNADGNAFMSAIKTYNPDCEVQFAYVGSYEDVAKAKEIAVAMAAAGCDIIQTDAGKCQVGIIEAAKEAGILVCGDTNDYSENYPEGVYGFFGGDFTNCVYLMIKDYVEGNFQGGTTGIMNLANECFFLTPDMFENFKTLRPDYAEDMDKAIALYDELYAQVLSGELKIPFNTDTPNWANYQ